MASILDRYGIKEVADVTFYKLNDQGQPEAPVLYLDTLKVSTVEQTASTADATGGKGNAKLISWDYGKEINVTLEDALFSPKSMSLMFGREGNVKTAEKIKRNVNFLAKAEDSAFPKAKKVESGYELAADGDITVTWYSEKGEAIGTDETPVAGSRYIGEYEVTATASHVIEVDAAHFPGTYYIVGDTYARNEANGEDEFFQFVIYKAKVTSENTITLQAEGDPSTFSLNLTVLRNDEGKMMDLIQYKV